MVEAASPAERKAILDRECGDDAGLRQRVEALLAAHDAEAAVAAGGTRPSMKRSPWKRCPAR